MAWNVPGSDAKKNNDDKDPWTGKPKQPTPPDLEQMLRKVYKQMLQFLGGNSSREPNASNTVPTSKMPSTMIGIVVSVLLVIWFFWGIFIVNPAEQGVVLRFGHYLETVGPGPHWIPPIIEEVYTVNEQKISTYSYDAEMLTKDENIVSVAVAVQYRVIDAKAYLFNVVKPQESLQQATASALRQVIGQTNLDQILTSGRDKVRQSLREQLDKILGRYNTGLLVTDVAMQPAKAPEEVKDAFDDAIKAQEDEQRYENQAETYAMQVEPIAKGQAQRLLADAQAYQAQAVLHAKAEVTPFLALLPEYKKSPQVMHERLYLETQQAILQNNSKVLVDSKGNDNSMFYLPLDKLFQSINSKVNVPSSTVAPPLSPTVSSASSAASDSTRPNRSDVQGGY